MNIIRTELSGVIIFEPDIYSDERGWFYESWSVKKHIGIDADFVQDNCSFSKNKGTLRGLHYQNSPHSQAKLVSCTSGKILDVAVDIRKGSPTYCKWISVELSSENFRQLFIPRGFAHGFLTLTDNVKIQYKVNSFYSKECDKGIRWDDPTIGIEWNIDNPILSEKDRNAPLLADASIIFE